MNVPAVKQEIKSLKDCTPQQKKFIAALCSHDILDVPRRERWRWAATQAGYAKDTTITQILGPIQHIVAEAAQKVLAESSVEAAWTVRETLTGDVDANTKVRISAAQDILDRTVGKKNNEDGSRVNPPMAVLVLPAKQIGRIIDQAGNEDVSTSS